MLRKLLAVVVVGLALVASNPAQVGAAGGGGNGGGSPKVATVRLTGMVTAIQPVIGGTRITLGTSYYATGTFVVTPNTKIKLNGSSVEYNVADVRLGDSAQADVIWTTKIANKMEVLGLR